MLNRFYLRGIDILKSRVSIEDKNYSSLGVLEDRLRRVIEKDRITPFDNENQLEKNRILHALNEISLESLTSGQDFFDLCYSRGDHYDNNLREGVFLYGNIMGYSSLSHIIQKKVNQLTTKIMEEFLSHNPDLWFDFKGGYLLLFIDRNPRLHSLYAPLKAFVLGMSLQLQFQQHNIRIGDQSLRMGITILQEMDAEFLKIGNARHFIGSAINKAKLFMNFSGEDHFFISRDIFHSADLRDVLEMCRGKEISYLLSTYNETFDHVDSDWLKAIELALPQYYLKQLFHFKCEPFTFIDHSKRDHLIYNFSLITDSFQIGNSAHPYHRVPLEIRDDRKPSPKEKFIRRLVEADYVCILGMTNENLVREEQNQQTFVGFLNDALKARNNRFWRKLQIVFPDETIIRQITEGPRETEERLDKWAKSKDRIFRFLSQCANDVSANWEIREYSGNLPFVGNKFVGPGFEFIRYATLIPGQDLKKLMYIELTPELAEEYKKLSKAFDVISQEASVGIKA